ncbi:hypothetical protein ERX35_008035 [Macrococcus equipercicus]|uniref:TNase-like domain-containing protein n=2 Tax=Macrococcus equipercicus TaxID=69967 RepID=A0ABQ6R7X4_9STAP|nr:hypothetical protein ERX35_008035 [Macrococcus equipercicus]
MIICGFTIAELNPVDEAATTTASSSDKKMIAEKPTTEKPTTEEPTTEKPTTEEPTTEKPTTEKPTTEEPTTEEPETKKKITDDNKKGTVARLPVTLAKTVDGDTAYFNDDNNEIKARFLLIDTPETKHPRMGVQPFGPEASARTAELLNNAASIEVEYDVGEKQDHYGRDLVYVYADGKMVNETLVREGLARVTYVYPPNTRYLDTLKTAENQAKAEQIGIWSLDSAFEDTTEAPTAQPVTTEPPTVAAPVTEAPQQFVQPAQPAAASEVFANCTDLRGTYPGGVPQGHPAYTDKMDRDNDGYACEIN